MTDDPKAAEKAAEEARKAAEKAAEESAKAATGDDAKAAAEAEAKAADARAAAEQAALDADASFNPSEFPTEWHRERFIADTEREIEGAKVRGDEDAQANAERQLARVKGQGNKQTRPRGAGKQTR